jgi:hypothetical protein
MAGPDAPVRYKSGGLEPDSRGEQSAFRGAEHLAREHLAWLAGAPAEPPYLHVAEPRAGQRVGRPNSAWPEDAAGHRRMLCLLPQFVAAARTQESVLPQAGPASESLAPRRWAGEHPAWSSLLAVQARTEQRVWEVER